MKSDHSESFLCFTKFEDICTEHGFKVGSLYIFIFMSS